jgi:hypothetical protein
MLWVISVSFVGSVLADITGSKPSSEIKLTQKGKNSRASEALGIPTLNLLTSVDDAVVLACSSKSSRRVKSSGNGRHDFDLLVAFKP